jgi:hypothetical protein
MTAHDSHPGHRGTAADVPHPGCDTSSTARGEQVATVNRAAHLHRASGRTHGQQLSAIHHRVMALEPSPESQRVDALLDDLERRIAKVRRALSHIEHGIPEIGR